MSLTSTYTLADGHKIPVVGFGTWQTPDGDVAEEAVKVALAAGYRHIDTAAIYGNERSVGKAIADFGIAREELFITSKLWNTNQSYDDATTAIDESLEKLGLDYLDLYLIHWSNPKSSRGDNSSKRNNEVWRAMEDAVTAGKIRSIGVSNFYERHLEPLLKEARIKPVVNQIFLNPGDQQKEIVAYNNKNNILTEAYSPLGTGKMLDIPAVVDLAKKYNKTPAQLLLAWSLHKGYLPLPKSVTKERIESNTDIFFPLSSIEISQLDALEGSSEPAKDPDKVDY